MHYTIRIILFLIFEKFGFPGLDKIGLGSLTIHQVDFSNSEIGENNKILSSDKFS